jgi:ATP-dependent Clp protease adaptor protein ClpS
VRPGFEKRRGLAYRLIMRVSPAPVFRTAATKPAGEPESQTSTMLEPAERWLVVVINDPVNLMSYVVLVFKKVFGFNEATARRHMLEVHEAGRSVVWSGLREQAEHYAFILQHWHLTAIIEPDETH